MKVKLFGEEGSKEVFTLEEKINAWLEQHPKVKVVHIKQSASGGSLQETKLYISIWYKEE